MCVYVVKAYSGVQENREDDAVGQRDYKNWFHSWENPILPLNLHIISKHRAEYILAAKWFFSYNYSEKNVLALLSVWWDFRTSNLSSSSSSLIIPITGKILKISSHYKTQLLSINSQTSLNQYLPLTTWAHQLKGSMATGGLLTRWVWTYKRKNVQLRWVLWLLQSLWNST